MARIAIGYGDLVSGSAISATSALVTLPAANLGAPHMRKVWRGQPGTTTVSILVDFGASVAIGGLALVGCNLTAAATWAIKLSTSDPTGAAGDALTLASAAAGVDPSYRMAIKLLAGAVTGRYLLVTIVDASLSYLEAGVLWAGPVWYPANNFRFGAQDVARDYSKRFSGNDGQVWILRGSLQRGLQFTLPAVTDAERYADGRSLRRTSGLHHDVMIVADPAASNLGSVSVYGLLDELPAYELAFPGRNVASFRVMERL